MDAVNKRSGVLGGESFVEITFEVPEWASRRRHLRQDLLGENVVRIGSFKFKARGKIRDVQEACSHCVCELGYQLSKDRVNYLITE